MACLISPFRRESSIARGYSLLNWYGSLMDLNRVLVTFTTLTMIYALTHGRSNRRAVELFLVGIDLVEDLPFYLWLDVETMASRRNRLLPVLHTDYASSSLLS